MTLVEMLIAMAIMAIVFSAVVPQFRAIQNSWDSKQANAETLQNGRVLIDYLNQNLSKALRITAVSGPAETDGYIEFEDNDASNLRFDINGTSNYVEFGPVGTLSDLAGPVSQLLFTCYDGNDFDTAITDVNDIRFIKIQTTLTNPAAMGKDKTFTTYTYLRTSPDTEGEGLVGWWKLDETSLKNAADSSGNGNDGMLTFMLGNEWTTGNIGGCLEFDGDNDYVKINDDESLHVTDAITLSAWVWHNAFKTGQPERYVTVRSEIAVIRKESDERLHFYIKTDGTLKHLRASSVLTEGYWYHVAGTWDGTTQRLYLDGVELDNQTPGGVLDNTFLGVDISSSTESINGLLDDVRIYNRALSAEEIASLANILTYKELTETKAGTDVTSITIQTPSSTREGDLLIAAVAADWAVSYLMTPPAGQGWTLISRNNYNNKVSLGIWWKLADASESPSHEFKWSFIPRQAYGWMMRFMGSDLTNPIDIWTANGEDSANPTSPAVTTSFDDSIILRLGAFDDDYITLNDPGLSGHTAITMDSSNRTDIYWADEEVDKIRRADLDGSNIEDLVSAAAMKPRALALDLDGGKMYWADEEVAKIRRSNLDGSNIEDLVTSVNSPRGLALDIAGGKMYWADEDVAKIRRSDLDGSNIEDLVTSVARPRALAVDISGGKMYWADDDVNKIRRANLDGSNIEDLVTSIGKPSAMALDVVGGKMYWTDDDADKIQRSNLDGSNIEDLLTGVTRPKALGIDIAGGKMYWADEDLDKIRRANLDGSNIEEIIIAATMRPKALALALNEAGSGTVSGGAGYIKQAAAGSSGLSSFSLTASQESRVVTLAIAPDPDGGGGGGIAP